MKTEIKILILLLSFWSTVSFGQSNPDFITKQQALEDLKIFEISLKEIHPNIYRYTSKSEFDNAFKLARDTIRETIKTAEFDKIINRMMVMVRCGHSFDISSFVDNTKGLLPLDIKILNNKIFVFRNYASSNELQPGYEILKINGYSSKNLLELFRRNAVADGYNTTFKDRFIERDFRGKYAILINQPDSFRIEFEDNGTGILKTISINAASNELLSKKINQENSQVEQPLGFYIDKENDVAILKLRSFMAKSIRKKSGQKLNHAIKKSFKEIERNKISNLIIDVRGNTGGKASAPPVLFSHITNSDFSFKQKMIMRHGYEFTYPQYLNRIKFDDWVNKHFDKKINDTTFEWTHHRNSRKPYRATSKPFLGKVYIIVNGMTASAGAEFVSLAFANNRGIIVGEETGGDFNGVNGGERTYLRLPHSKIGVLIAGRRNIMAWPENSNIGHGVYPNYEVQPTMNDLLTGRDAEMEFIYQAIKKK